MSAWAWVLVCVIVLIGAMIVLMMRPAQVDIRVAGGDLFVEPLGLDKIWCVRGKITVPLSQVTSIEVIDRHSLPRPGLRLPGSYLPGVITAGSYGLGGQRTFWDVRRAGRLLVVSCRPGSAYRQLVVEVPQPDAIAAQLRAHVSE